MRYEITPSAAPAARSRAGDAITATFTEALTEQADLAERRLDLAGSTLSLYHASLGTLAAVQRDRATMTRALATARDIATYLPHAPHCAQRPCACSVLDLLVVLGLACWRCGQGLDGDAGLMCATHEGALTHHTCDNGCVECAAVRSAA